MDPLAIIDSRGFGQAEKPIFQVVWVYGYARSQQIILQLASVTAPNIDDRKVGSMLAMILFSR